MSDKLHRIAVYGSLKKGWWNHSLMDDAAFIGEAKTQPIFTMVSLGSFPAVQIEGETAIHCEVYDVNDGVLATLDRLEGHPHWYNRIQVATDHGPAWMYVMPRDMEGRRPIVASGNWSK